MQYVIKDIKNEYGINLRIATVIALLIIILIFVLSPNKIQVQEIKPHKQTEIISEDLPPELEQIAQPPPEEKVAVPVAAENEEEAEAATMAETEFAEIYQKPEESVEVPIVPYFKVEVKPKLKYKPSAKYPDIAKEAGVEGKVIVNVLVETDGHVSEAKVVKSSGDRNLDAAALEAARKATFTPAKQRDKFVRVWVAIPFDFVLEEE